jgi:hypothetical protein
MSETVATPNRPHRGRDAGPVTHRHGTGAPAPGAGAFPTPAVPPGPAPDGR